MAYINGLTIDDYKKFLCDNYKTGITYKKEKQASTQVTFSQCEFKNSPDLSFTELTLDQYLGSGDTVTVTSKNTSSVMTAVTFTPSAALNTFTIASQNFFISREGDFTEQLFYTEDALVIGSTNLPKNVKINYASEITSTKIHKTSKNSTELKFSNIGYVQAVPATYN